MGIDNLPEEIRNSKILTGNELAILAAESIPQKISSENNLSSLKNTLKAKQLLLDGKYEAGSKILSFDYDKRIHKKYSFPFKKNKYTLVPVFIIGCGRSGTTILGKTLSNHPKIKYLNERRDLYINLIQNLIFGRKMF